MVKDQLPSYLRDDWEIKTSPVNPNMVRLVNKWLKQWELQSYLEIQAQLDTLLVAGFDAGVKLGFLNRDKQMNWGPSIWVTFHEEE